MGRSAVKSIALEFGKSPKLRLAAPDELPASRCFLISSSGGFGKSSVLLRACESLYEMVSKPTKSPEWLIMVDEAHRTSPRALDTLYSKLKGIRSEFKDLPVLGLTATPDPVLFLCRKSPELWSVEEKAEFRDELAIATDFLTQLVTPPPDPPEEADSDRRLELARELRDRLLANEKWIDAPAVHVQQGGNPMSQGINNTASRLRRRTELLGAWNGREFLHPVFQFSADTGRLMPEMKTLLEILPKDRSGWRQCFWLFQAHRQLAGSRPADVFQKDPQAVIQAARSDFEVSDERW